MLPRHRFPRIAAIAWLLAAVVMLVVTLARPELASDEREGLSTLVPPLVPLYFLSFPLGHVAVMTIGWTKLQMFKSAGGMPAIQDEAVWLWAGLTLLGYLQWFALLPWLARQVCRMTDFLFNRHPAR